MDQPSRKTLSGDHTTEYGLQELASGGSDPNAYIVAIHGLMGDAVTTWQNPVTQQVWLRDTLPEAIPSVTIFTFGYDAGIFTKSWSDLTDVSGRLLADLSQKLKTGKPVFFVCHSLGGIVFKKTLIVAHEQDDRYGDIIRCTKGVVFLGVPHAGSALADLGQLTNILSLASFRIISAKGQFTELLKQNSKELTEISRSCVHRLSRISIKTFYETRKTSKYKFSAVVVNRESATIGIANETPTGLDEDHESICKPGIANRKLIEGVLADMIRETILVAAPSAIQEMESPDEVPKTSEGDDRLLGNLFVVTRAELLQHIANPVVEACSWILDDTTYFNWLTDPEPRSLLWIEAPAGYGKTVLAWYLLTSFERKESNVCAFFCNSSNDNQNHGASILRTILYDLLTKNPKLMKHARHAQLTKGEKWMGNLYVVAEVFEHCLNDPDLSETYIIVDALDEYKDIQESLQWIFEALENPSGSQSKIRVVLTSRPNLSVPNKYRNKARILKLDERMSQRGAGFEQYVRVTAGIVSDESLQSMQGGRDWLVSELKSRSQGCFLWVSLIVKDLRKDNFLNKGRIQKALALPPSNINRVYSDILAKINISNQGWARHLLQTIVATYTPLTITQVGWLVSAYQCHEIYGQLEQIQDFKMDNFGEKLRMVFSGLLKVVDEHVHLEHATVKEFLTGSLEEELRNSSWARFSVEDASLVLAQSCVWRLQTFSSRDVNDTAEFESYACLHGPRHIRDTDTLMDQALADKVKEIYSSRNDTFENWRSRYCAKIELDMFRRVWEFLQSLYTETNDELLMAKAAHVSDEERLSKDSSKLRTASFFGHQRVFRALIEEDPSVVNTVLDDGWTPLCTAIDREQYELVTILLERGADPNLASVGLKTPLSSPKTAGGLHFATRLPDVAIMDLLLTKTEEVDSQTPERRTALFFAACYGNTQIVQRLIDKNADIDHTDNEGNAALHAAAKLGHEKVIDILLSKGANINRQNHAGKSPMILAAESGLHNVVRIFITLLSTEMLLTHHKLVLHAAARSEDDETLRVLLNHDVDVHVKDDSGLSAFAYLDASCATDVIQLFLERKADINERDADGRTLLHKTVKAVNVPTAEFLLCNGADVHAATSNGDKPLHAAVRGRYNQDMFELLMNQNADMESRNSSGYTPFHLAVASWRSFGTLRRLIKFKPDIESRNLSNYTPLQTAILDQNAGLVYFLVFELGASTSVMTAEGFSVFDLAEASFIKNFGTHSIRGTLQVPYQLYAYASEPRLDDMMFQKHSGSLAEIFVSKIDRIREVLTSKPPPHIKRHRIGSLEISFRLSKESSVARPETVSEIDDASTLVGEPTRPPSPGPGPDATRPMSSSTTESPHAQLVLAGSTISPVTEEARPQLSLAQIVDTSSSDPAA